MTAELSEQFVRLGACLDLRCLWGSKWLEERRTTAMVRDWH